MIIRNIIKYTIGLPFMIALTLSVVVFGGFCALIEYIVFGGDMYNSTLQTLTAIWKPVK